MAALGAAHPGARTRKLIGGEVTLLPPDDHAAALLTMRRHGREPMSTSHGDVDHAYLARLVLDRHGGAGCAGCRSPGTSTR